MTTLGVIHHGDPDWYYTLDTQQQTAVNAVLDLLESDDAQRFDLPIAMNGTTFDALKRLKLERRQALGPRRRPITVVDGGKRRQADDDEQKAFAGAADAMARKALIESGWTEKALDFWFSPDAPANLEAEARRTRKSRDN